MVQLVEQGVDFESESESGSRVCCRHFLYYYRNLGHRIARYTCETQATITKLFSFGSKTSAPSPKFKLVRTLGEVNETYAPFGWISGTVMLTWSPDGERFAAYVRAGQAIAISSPDGKTHYEIPRYFTGSYAENVNTWLRQRA